MPTRIAIEAKPVDFEGIDTGFLNLYLVKTQTDSRGRVLSEKVSIGAGEQVAFAKLSVGLRLTSLDFQII